MIAFLPTRRAGISVFVWIGSVGLHRRRDLEALIDRYVQQHTDAIRARLLPTALDVLHRHREAGASEVLITSAQRWVLMHELRGDPEPDLTAQLAIMSPCDLVLVEGFKSVQIPKIEIHRPAHGRPLLHPDNPAIVAVATDAPPDGLPGLALPRLDLNDPAAVAEFILRHQGLL